MNGDRDVALEVGLGDDAALDADEKDSACDDESDSDGEISADCSDRAGKCEKEGNNLDRAALLKVAETLEVKAGDAYYPLSMTLDDTFRAVEFVESVLKPALSMVTATVCFCIPFAVMLAYSTRNTYDTASAVLSVLAPDGSGSPTVQFRDINSPNAVYSWLNDTFTPALFVSTDLNGDPLPHYQVGRIATTNQVLGGVILEVTRMEIGACDASKQFVELYPNCSHHSESGEPVVTYLDINTNATAVSALLTQMKNSGNWINYHTKKFTTTVATFNGEVEVFTVTRMVVEFLHSGAINLQTAINSVPVYGRADYPVTLSLGIITLYVALVVRAAQDEAFARSRLYAWMTNKWLVDEGGYWGRLKHQLAISVIVLFKSAWLLFFIVVFFVARLKLFLKSDLSALAEQASSDADERLATLRGLINELDGEVQVVILLKISGVISAIPLSLLLIRQLRFHPQFNIFVRTVGSSLRQFGAFFAIFVIIFQTFALVGNVVFGDRILQFSTMTRSMESCVNMLFGEFDYDSIRSVAWSGVYYWSYMVVVSLVLLNMMLAIVMRTYEEISTESARIQGNTVTQADTGLCSRSDLR